MIEVRVARLSTMQFRESDLSAEERARAAAFRDPTDRRRHLAGRWLLRRALSGCGRDPGEAPGGHGGPPPGCSLSRSDDLGIVAVAERDPLGVDIEVEGRWHLASEALGIADAARAASVWVRIEAVLKAVRIGLGKGLPAALVERCAAPGLMVWAGLDLEVSDLEIPGARTALAAPPGLKWRLIDGS